LISRNNHILVFLLALLLFPGFDGFGQGYDNALLSHEKFLSEFNKSNPQIISKIDELEKNWECLRDKDKILLELIGKTTQPKLLEYLNILQAYFYQRSSDWENGLNILNKISNQKGYFPGHVHFFTGRMYLYSNDLAKSLTAFTKADEYFGNSDYLINIQIKGYLIEIFSKFDNIELAKKEYYEGLMVCEKNNYAPGRLILYQVYGLASSNRDPEYSMEILEKGWELIKYEPIDLRIKYAVNYLKLLATKKQWLIFDEVYKSVRKDFKNTCQADLISIIETLYAHKMTIGSKIDSAIYFNNRALQLRKMGTNHLFVGYSFLNLSNNYLILEKYSKSKLYLDSARLFLYENGKTVSKIYYLKSLLNYFEKNKQIDSVFDINSRLASLNDKFFYDQQNFLIAKLSAENEINRMFLENKYNSEIEARKMKLRYTTIISILFIVLAIILAFWLVRSYKNLRLVKLTSKRTFESLDDYKREVSQLKNVFENATTGLFILDETYQIKFVNKRAENIFSSFNYEIGQNFCDLFSGETLDEVNRSLKSVVTNRENNETQVNIASGGRYRYVSLSIAPLMIGDNLDSVLIIVIDVSDKVKALELEKNQRVVLQTLFNSINESIVIMDKAGIIKLINRTGAKRLGTSDKKLIGVNYFDILPGQIRNARIQKINMAVEEKRPIIYDENIDSYSNMVSIYPSFDSDGELEYLSEFAQDIRDRRHAFEEINSLRQKVLRSQMNPHFIFNSLNAIQSYVLKNDSAQAVKYLNSFARLIRMILESSRFDYISLDKEISILRYYLELQQLRFGEKFSYSLDVDESINTEMILIPAMLAQPFIENAIEHGLQHIETDGLVSISFVKATDSIIFKVSDNGIGREKSKIINKLKIDDKKSLSTTLFKERLDTLNRYSGQKITYTIIDLKDDDGSAKGTLVIINLPIIYQSNIV